MTEKIRDDIIKIYKMLTSPQGAYSYDANGNLTSVANKQYGYDLFNRLTSFSDGSTTATYTYNGDGQRMSKTVNGITKYFVWHGENVVLEYEKNSSGGVVNAEKYIFAPDGIMAKITSSGAVVSYAKDSKGSVNATLDANGNIIESLQYDAYGKRIGDNANSAEKFGYAGEYYDSETGLIYLRNRYYDPTIRIFITQDPAMDGSNWYSYCGNNPVMFVDPFGLYYITSNDDRTYTLKKDSIMNVIFRSGASVILSESIVGDIENALGRISGNSLSQGDAYTEGSIGQIRNQHPILDSILKIKDAVDSASMVISGIDIILNDEIAFGLLQKGNISTSSTNSEHLDNIMKYTYGFMNSLNYFSTGIPGEIFKGDTLHKIDYDLSQSKDPQKEIKKYYKRAFSYYVSAGYNVGEAKGAAGVIESYLNHYQERRNYVFDLYKEYMDIVS